jgi:SulP family sulfate permease
VAAAFGGSRFQVTGPTGAMTAVLLGIVAEHGVGALPLLGLGAGVILFALGLGGVGRYVRFVPWPVVTGFTNGIAVIIFLQQLPAVLGVPQEAAESILLLAGRTASVWLQEPTFLPLVLAALTVAVMLAWRRVEALAAVPASMAALVVVSVVSLLPAFEGVARIGALPRSLPLPVLPTLPAGDGWVDLVRAALAVAVLAALESLLCAVVADGMTVGEKHDPDRELVGQGLGNIAAGLFGGLPATAALARTAVNVRSGARTRLAAMVHALTLLVVVLFLAPLAARVPLAVLGGILMVVAVRMVERHASALIMRSTKSDAFVMLLTLVVTVLFDLILAIEVGLVAAAVLFIVRMSTTFRVDPLDLAGSDVRPLMTERDAQALERVRDRVVAFRIEGPIFFGAAERFIDQMLKADQGIRVVILRLRKVPVLDATGATALRALSERIARRGGVLLLSALQPQPANVLRRMGLYDELTAGGRHDFPTTEQAVAAAVRLAEEEAERQATDAA